MNADASERMSAGDRREQIIIAAAAVFGERGYAGGTTDAIARQAGISQAYVVRMFGSKENLFVEVGNYASTRVIAAFRGAIAGFPPDAPVEARTALLGEAYGRLMEDRGLLLSLLQLFSQGHDPVLGAQARRCYLDVYRVARDEAGLGPQAATAFFSTGMLVTVLTAMRMQDAIADPDAAELLSCVLGAQEPQFLELMSRHKPLGDARR